MVKKWVGTARLYHFSLSILSAFFLYKSKCYLLEEKLRFSELKELYEQLNIQHKFVFYMKLLPFVTYF